MNLADQCHECTVRGTFRLIAYSKPGCIVSKILLVDDDRQVNEVVKATLEMLGHTVTAVERAEKVESIFIDFEPDVTLVDYMLPGIFRPGVAASVGSRASRIHPLPRHGHGGFPASGTGHACRCDIHALQTISHGRRDDAHRHGVASGSRASMRKRTRKATRMMPFRYIARTPTGSPAMISPA